MNIRNQFTIIGRLTQDPTVFDNKDGSKKVRFTVAATDNFASADGKRGSQFLPVEAFRSAAVVNKSGLGIYANIHQGDLVAVSGQIQNNNYTDKNNAKHYDLVLHVETCDPMEPKSVTDARQINRAVAADAAAGDAAPAAESDEAVE